MIQVIKRTVQILELLTEHSEAGYPLNDIAGSLKINQSTCANILKTLIELDLVEQPVPRKAYFPGPKLFYLARSGPYRRDISHTGKPHIKQLASEINASVLIAILRQGKRFILCSAEGSSVFQMKREFLYRTDIYTAATGRMLLAEMDTDDLETVLAEHGLPAKDEWPEANTPEALNEELKTIKKEGRVIISEEKAGGIAVPIQKHGVTVAALGVILPGLRKGDVLKSGVFTKIKKTAGVISRAISEKGRIN